MDAQRGDHTISCRGCYFAVVVKDTNGVCRRNPPVVIAIGNGQTTSSFPPVNLDTFWCGEFSRRVS